MGLKRWIEQHPARAGAVAGWYQQGCSGLATFVVFPLIVKRLGDVDAGLWFVFQAIIAVINLTDFGLSFVIARQIAFSLGTSGGTKVVQGDFLLTRHSWEGISDVYMSSLTLFRRLGLITLLLLAAIYHIVLPHGKLLQATYSSTTLTWYLMGAAAILSLQAKPHLAMADGLSRVYFTRFLGGTVQLLSGFGVVLVLFMGGRLAEMAAVVACASVVHLVLARWSVQRLTAGRLDKSAQVPPGLMRGLLKVAVPMGVVNLSAFLFSSIQIPLLGILLGPAVVPGFFLAQKIGQLINQGVMQIVGPQLPLYTQDLAQSSFSDAKSRMLRIILTVTFLALIANLFFLFASPIFVDLWLGPGRYIATAPLLIIAIDYFLLTASVVWAQFVLASGSNPFVRTTMLAGILNVVLGVVMARFGLWGIALASLLAGLCTNYWFTTWQGIKLHGALMRMERDNPSPPRQARPLSTLG